MSCENNEAKRENAGDQPFSFSQNVFYIAISSNSPSLICRLQVL